MAPHAFRPTAVPQCLACTKRITALGFKEWQPFRQQFRGKARAANGASVTTVRLTRDLKGYGRAGSIVPISSGRMRNDWYPRGVADYLTQTETKDLKLKNVPIERDYAFISSKHSEQQRIQREKEEAEALEKAEEKALQERMETIAKGQYVGGGMTPKRATELISILVPNRLDFYRQRIENEADPQARQETVSSTGSIAEAFMAAKQVSQQLASPDAIYGSVTKGDILSSIRAVLANNEEASRVVLSEDDLNFSGGVAEGGRQIIKKLGEFKVSIQVKGAPDPVMRTVRVLEQRE
ncbi:MAG: hypothetical protein M1820_007417 [Bogoriella megaspora]|nr:MAG: hypothetical protein M1820_007417 [Bogoriella megaspora]